jgi:hypothetical protein
MGRLIFSTMLVLVLPGALFGQILWEKHILNDNFPTGCNVVYACDLDDDTDNDVIGGAGSAGTGYLIWWENDNGASTWTEHSIPGVMARVLSISAEDLSGDGNMDLVLAATYSGSDPNGLFWFRNDGNENFTEDTVDLLRSPMCVYAGKLDADADVDVLATGRADTGDPPPWQICWYSNDGSGNFTKNVIEQTTASSTPSVYAEDLDNDGDSDVIGAQTTNNDVFWFRNGGSGNFGAKQMIDNNLTGAKLIYAEDIDGDTDVDVLAANNTMVVWYASDGANPPVFSGPYTIASSFSSIRSVYAEDIDGDGDMDVLVADYTSDQVAWLENDGDENFTKNIIQSNANGAKSIHAKDLDEDGDVDVVGAIYSDHDFLWWENIPRTLDVSAVSIDIDSPIIQGTTIDPLATVTNLGAEIATFTVTCEIEPGGYSSTETVTNLAPGASVQDTFAPPFTFAPGSYTVTVYTDLIGDVCSENDTIQKIIEAVGGNVSTTSINMPTYVLSNTTLNPKATIRNLGSFSETFDVTCEIEPGGYSSTETITDLAPGTSVQDTFTPSFQFMSGSYTVTVYTKLTGDIDTGNDTLEKIVSVDDTPPSAFNLISPLDSIKLNNPKPTLIWQASSDDLALKEYRVYVDDILMSTKTDTSWTPTTNLQDGWHDWYIIAYDSAGNSCRSNETWSIFIDATPPTTVNLISPTNGAYINNSTINFMWNESSDALSGIEVYILQYAHDNTFSSGLVTDTLVDTTFTEVLAETTWYWRVRAKDSVGNICNWSSVWSFEIDTQVPNVPTLVFPIGGSYLGDTLVTFEWTEVTNIAPTSSRLLKVKRIDNFKEARRPLGSRSQVLYIVQIDTLSDFASPIIIDTSETTSITILLYDDLYYWRIYAFDLAGNQSPYADPDSFGVDTTAPVIESTTVWSDTNYAGPFEIKTKVIDELAGVDAVRLFYRRDEDAMWFTLDMDPSGSPDWFVDFIPSVSNVNDTVRYYLKADDNLESQPGNVATDPIGAPTNYYWFIANHYPGVMDFGDMPISFSFGLKSNPAKGKAIFNLALPEPGNITLRIYDISGRLIDQLISEKKSAGYYETPWITEVNAGIYFYYFESPWEKKVGKLVVVR